MKDLIPKGYLGWIWSIGILVMIGLVIYTIITDTSPFQKLGMDPTVTTIVFGALVGVLLFAPMIFRKR